MSYLGVAYQNRRGAVSFRKKGIGTRDYRDYQGDNLYKYYSQVKKENQYNI